MQSRILCMYHVHPVQAGPDPFHSFCSRWQSCSNVLSAIVWNGVPQIFWNIHSKHSQFHKEQASLWPSAILIKTDPRRLSPPYTHPKEHSNSWVPTTCTTHTRPLLSGTSRPVGVKDINRSAYQQNPSWRNKGPPIWWKAETDQMCFYYVLWENCGQQLLK